MSEEPRVFDAAHVRGALASGESWLRLDALDGLAEINEQCLELMCDQAECAAGSSPAVLIELRSLWCGLDGAARRRAARCPVLLVDAGFMRTARWERLHERRIHDRERTLQPSAFFTVPRTIAVTRLVLAYGWHLARGECAAARLFLGMSPPCVELIAACTLRTVIQLAESRPDLLRPRWTERLRVWRDLLTWAQAEDSGGLECVRLRGMQLLAAEARSWQAAQVD
ncbi:MAG TPA: hypothetical protein VMU67_15915 [Steroidobacteraceae bacterium]|nr:hypothetical protein [Steroidobacteraceae bacterium]